MHEIAVFICVCIHTCILIRTVRRFYIVVVKLLLCESHPFFPFKKWIRSTFLEVSNEHAREHTHTRTHTSSTRPEIFQSGDSLFLACAFSSSTSLLTSYSSALLPPPSSPVVHSSRKSLVAFRSTPRLTFPPRWSR